MNRERTFSSLIHEPGFWAYQLALHFDTEEVDEPSLSWLGISAEVAVDWYVRHIESEFKAQRWPFIRAPLPGSNRVLLGYFSLPAMRPEQARYIAMLTDHYVANLMWLNTVYLTGAQAGTVRGLVERLVSAIPQCRADKRSEIADAFLENRIVEDLAWTMTASEAGSTTARTANETRTVGLSILGAEDFAFVREFFSGAG